MVNASVDKSMVLMVKLVMKMNVILNVLLIKTKFVEELGETKFMMLVP